MMAIKPETRKALRDSRLNLADALCHGWPQGLQAKTKDGEDRGVSPKTARMLMDKWKEEMKPVRDDMNLCVITAMTEDVFAKVVNEGWKSLWDVGPTWHDKYVPEGMTAEQCRMFTEQRSFGNHCPDLCHGILFWDGMQNTKEVENYLLTNFGNVLVEWKREVWDVGSITYGDSQQNIMAWPFSLDNVNKLIVGHSTDFGERVCPWVFLPEVVGLSNRNPYIEVQIHGGGLTSEKMDRVSVV